jgi:hypothetical protein
MTTNQVQPIEVTIDVTHHHKKIAILNPRISYPTHSELSEAIVSLALEDTWERVTFGGLDNRTPRGPYPFQRDDAGGKVLGRGRVARVIRPITSYGPDAFKHVGAWTLFVAVP